ncbi:MAG: ATP phosphoribosyltransferase regulatory subunit [Solobacterium sp.]|nr:ATP phosphoribosyltransferase regulatory subunit [Solobacterium sp.]
MTPEEKLNRLFASFGYRKFRMAKFEEYDLYASNRDFLTSSQIITFNDLDGKLLALKPDITLSIIKSTFGPRRVYYNEMVYRVRDRHYREIPQAGVECIGEADPYMEAEVIALAANALKVIEENCILRISDVSLLDTLVETLEVPESYREYVIEAMASKRADYLRGLGETGILCRQNASVLASLSELYLPLKQGVREVGTIVSSEELKPALDHLARLCDILEGFGVLEKAYLDLSLINSMDYYNGIIFQGAVSTIPVPVLSGGRYDRLCEKMGKPFGAVGFAVYMDAVENRRRQNRHYDGDILILYTKQDDPCVLAGTVRKLTEQGYKVLAAKKQDAEENRWKRVMTLEEAVQEAKL